MGTQIDKVMVAQGGGKAPSIQPLQTNMLEENGFFRKIQQIPQPEHECNVNQVNSFCTTAVPYTIGKPVKAGNVVTITISYTGSGADTFMFTLSPDGKSVQKILMIRDGKTYSITDNGRVKEAKNFLMEMGVIKPEA